MRKKLVLLSAMALFTAACFHVVVNVYFPESEAKGALATLEEELLRGVPASQPAPPPQGEAPAAEPNAAPAPQGLLRVLPAVTPAHAAGEVSEEEIYNRIKGMPSVVEAYQRIKTRLPRVEALKNRGVVGEGKEGLLKPRGEVPDRKDQRTLEEENADRTEVIRGLAKAILQAQGLPASRENMDQVLESAAATFASLRREQASAGQWIEKPNGNWVQK